MAYNGSIGKSSNGLVGFMGGAAIDYLEEFSVTPGTAATFDISTFNSQVEELSKGKRSADTISITGRYTPSPQMQLLDQLSKSEETRPFSFLTYGGQKNGYFTGKAFDRLGQEITVKTKGVLANGVTTVVFKETGADLSPLAVGDYLVGTSPVLALSIRKRSVNGSGELVLELAGDGVAGTVAEKVLRVMAPAVRANVIASVTSFSPLPSRDDVQNFQLELQATGAINYVFGTPDVDVSDLTLPESTV